jgi:hypothetical protein
MRDGFIFYASFYEAINELDDTTQLELYKAIVTYGLTGEEPMVKGLTKAMFTLIKPQIDANQKRYENGKKGGRPKTETKPKNNLDETKAEPKEKEKEKVKDKDKENTPLPYQVLAAYKEHVSSENSKVVESSTMKELRVIKHDLSKVLIGIKNYGASIEDKNFIIRLDNFIKNKVYLDHQQEKKAESKLEGWK